MGVHRYPAVGDRGIHLLRVQSRVSLHIRAVSSCFAISAILLSVSVNDISPSVIPPFGICTIVNNLRIKFSLTLYNKFLHWSKLKPFADDNIEVIDELEFDL